MATSETKFRALVALLNEHRPFWSAQPFRTDCVAWETEYPELSQFFRGWSSTEVEQFESCPQEHPEAPALVRHLWQKIGEWTNLPSLHCQEFIQVEARSTWNIKQRKWAQIEAFLHCVPKDGLPTIVDWCCGKGHLARVIATQFQVRGVGLEKEADLCQKGRVLAGEQVRFVCVDVTKSVPDLPNGAAFFAMHSCGDLTDLALKTATVQHIAQLYSMPCCFHKIQGKVRESLSTTGRKLGFSLPRAALLIPSTFETRASETTRRRRRREMRYRTALDLLLRASDGRTQYRSFPSVPEQWKDISFEQFVLRVQQREGFVLPKSWNPKQWEAAGADKLRQVRAIASIRAVFSRAIEVALAYDRALWLEEQGWTVEVGTFCAVEVSPRNILLRCYR